VPGVEMGDLIRRAYEPCPRPATSKLPFESETVSCSAVPGHYNRDHARQLEHLWVNDDAAKSICSHGERYGPAQNNTTLVNICRDLPGKEFETADGRR